MIDVLIGGGVLTLIYLGYTINKIVVHYLEKIIATLSADTSKSTKIKSISIIASNLIAAKKYNPDLIKRIDYLRSTLFPEDGYQWHQNMKAFGEDGMKELEKELAALSSDEELYEYAEMIYGNVEARVTRDEC